MNNIAYFDNAATTFPKPEEVYLFTDKFHREYGVNVGRGQYDLASDAVAMVSETRELLLDLNHSPKKKVVFTPSATEAINVILNGLKWIQGGNVYLSPFEHNSVLRTLHVLQQKNKLQLRIIPVNKSNYTYDLSRLQAEFERYPPCLVVLSHASNVIGLIAPMIEIFELAKKYNAITLADMCQTMGLISIDLNNSSVDFAVFAGHKTLYAPLGVAGFICRPDVELEPLLFGGTGIDSANKDLPKTIPEKFEVGSLNVLAIAGLNAALKWHNRISQEKIFLVEKANHRRMINLLQGFTNVKIVPYNHEGESIGIVSCLFEGYSSDSIGQILNERKVAVRTGLHCAPDAHRFIGTFPDGTVRFSVSFFNDDKDFDVLEQALVYIEENS